jgi:hypothetical protein
MNCRISDSLWTDYLEQSLSRRERQEIESHLLVCAGCRSDLAVLRQVDQRLRIECARIRHAYDVSAASLASAEERMLAILAQGARQAGVDTEQERLWRVRWVLALLCGSNTATRIIAAAESHVHAGAKADSSEQKWLLLLRRLALITSEICGRHAGDLIWAVGK